MRRNLITLVISLAVSAICAQAQAQQVYMSSSGEIIFFLDGAPTRLGPGDIFTVPSGVPHSIQLITPDVRLVDTFHPIRDDFLE